MRDSFGKFVKIGSEYTYNGLHARVKRCLGVPKKCENCGVIGDRMYHWANKSGEYREDIDDWLRLCVPCHRKYDWSKRGYGNSCRHGHEYTDDNSYIYKGIRHCKACRIRNTKKWRQINVGI